MEINSKRYHVAIPYWFHFYVDAVDESDALDKAHETDGSMGEYDDDQAFIEESPHNLSEED
jgi:hypothetical protein